MKTALRLALLLALPALACGPLAAAPTATPLPPAVATVAAPATLAVTEPIIQCSPPPCADGVLECTGDCPGGCGTVCLALTPTPRPAAEGPTRTPVLVPGEFQPGAYRWALVAEGFDKPLLATHAGDGSGRLFVVEQTGVIRVLVDGAPLLQPFLDISTQVSGGFEQGLLGLAFHPNFPNPPYFYIDYTDVNGNTQVVRYTPSGDPNVAEPESATTILSVGQPYGNHNGGNLAFGPDGYLYVSLGDGGSAGDPQGNAQNLGVLLGKILRLDVDGGEPYAIPPDNPYAAGGEGRPEIWAYGLRNPWRYSFDRATGDLYIGDVGQAAYEEVDFVAAGSPAGQNFGWNYLEGFHPFQGGRPPEGLTLPIREYAQADGGCSVTGGYVYRGPSLPEVSGVYFYGDFCSGFVWTLARDASGAWQNNAAYATGFSITSFGEDEAGELYLLDQGGAVYRLERQ